MFHFPTALHQISTTVGAALLPEDKIHYQIGSEINKKLCLIITVG